MYEVRAEGRTGTWLDTWDNREDAERWAQERRAEGCWHTVAVELSTTGQEA